MKTKPNKKPTRAISNKKFGHILFQSDSIQPLTGEQNNLSRKRKELGAAVAVAKSATTERKEHTQLCTHGPCPWKEWWCRSTIEFVGGERQIISTGAKLRSASVNLVAHRGCDETQMPIRAEVCENFHLFATFIMRFIPTAFIRFVLYSAPCNFHPASFS